LRENTEAVFAACDAAHGRWAKLLVVRAVLHPKLRLVEFLSIYNITQEFITATEKVLYSFLYHEKNFLFMSVMLFVR
jgi:vacuolar protein sorting-associated protein 54